MNQYLKVLLKILLEPGASKTSAVLALGCKYSNTAGVASDLLSEMRKEYGDSIP